MYDELEVKSQPTQRLHRTHKQCQSGGPALLREELNRLKWFTLIKQKKHSVCEMEFILQPEPFYEWVLYGLCTIQQMLARVRRCLVTTEILTIKINK